MHVVLTFCNCSWTAPAMHTFVEKSTPPACSMIHKLSSAFLATSLILAHIHTATLYMISSTEHITTEYLNKTEIVQDKLYNTFTSE